jgi:hypothetical protein
MALYLPLDPVRFFQWLCYHFIHSIGLTLLKAERIDKVVYYLD